MLRENLIRYGGSAAVLGGALYLAIFGVTYLIYELFAEQAEETFFGQHAFIHMLDVTMFVLLVVGPSGSTSVRPTGSGRWARPAST